MTLFKKVFQSQAEPATFEDQADETALRAAFEQAEEKATEHLPDPFEKLRDRHEENTGSASNLDDVGMTFEASYEDCEAEDLQATEAQATFVSEAEGSGSDAHRNDEDVFAGVLEAMTVPEMEVTTQAQDSAVQDSAGSHEGQGDDLVPPSAENMVQTDDEIAACLDRAMAAGAPSEQCRSDAEGAVKAEALPAALQSVAPSPVVEAPGETDVARFAREQLAALSSQTEPEPAASDAPVDLSGGCDLASVPGPAAGRAGRRAGRVKTRLLGFNRTGDQTHDPFGQAPEATASAQSEKYPVGWLVIVEGPGVGHSFSIFTGASMIGRGEDQSIRLDFGDNSISRHNHAAVAYDEEENKFYIGHGGKSNIIRRNARPVLSTEELHHADLIRIGETTLRFVALCGSDFQWNTAGEKHVADA